ncbi:hypothetical protein D3C72_1584530 [compost metagenome]
MRVVEVIGQARIAGDVAVDLVAACAASVGVFIPVHPAANQQLPAIGQVQVARCICAVLRGDVARGRGERAHGLRRGVGVVREDVHIVDARRCPVAVVGGRIHGLVRGAHHRLVLAAQQMKRAAGRDVVVLVPVGVLAAPDGLIEGVAGGVGRVSVCGRSQQIQVAPALQGGQAQFSVVAKTVLQRGKGRGDPVF